MEKTRILTFERDQESSNTLQQQQNANQIQQLQLEIHTLTENLQKVYIPSLTRFFK